MNMYRRQTAKLPNEIAFLTAKESKYKRAVHTVKRVINGVKKRFRRHSRNFNKTDNHQYNCQTCGKSFSRFHILKIDNERVCMKCNEKATRHPVRYLSRHTLKVS